MARKSWITLKRGLSEDPKHRETMGMAIWAFIHIIDRADWETGKVFDWQDGAEAKDMNVNPRTLRDWRYRLEEAGYISCKQKRNKLEITIFKWVNPRDYSGKMLNTKDEGDTYMSPKANEVDTLVDTLVDSQNVTPTSSSKINYQRSKENPPLDFKNMSVKDAQKLPTLKLYLSAADYFPGSLVWEFVHKEIQKNNLTYQKINEAAVAWESKGFKRENVKGILEWAVNGIPKDAKSQVQSSAPIGPAYKPFVPKDEGKYVPPSSAVLDKLRGLKSKMSGGKS